MRLHCLSPTMKSCVFLSCFYLMLQLAGGAQTPAEVWSREAAFALPSGTDGCTDGASDSEGSLIVTGIVQMTGTLKLRTIKWSKEGVLLWNAGETSTFAQNSVPAVAVDAAGNIFVTGGHTVKYSPDGTKVWEAPASGPTTDIGLDSSGNVYTCGEITGSNGADFAVTKYSPTGVEVWTRFYDGTAHGKDSAAALTVLGDGVAVTGYVTTAAAGKNAFTVRYAGDGTPQWARPYDGPSGLDDESIAIAADGSGNLTIAGNSERDALIIRYSPAGDTLWTRACSYSPPSGSVTSPVETCRGLALLGDGSVGVCMSSVYQPGSLISTMVDIVLCQVNADGTPRNSTTAWGFSNLVGAVHSGCKVIPYGSGFLVSGSIPGVGRVSEFDAAGGLQWTASLTEPKSNFGTVLTPAGSGFFVAGGVSGGFPAWRASRFAPPPAASTPEAVTSDADQVTRNSVRLNGTVDPRGTATTWFFEFGLTTQYGSSTVVQNAGAGSSVVQAQTPNVAVQPGQTYHYRLVAVNAHGTDYGDDRTFITPFSPWQTWQSTNFGAVGAAGSGPQDDPDGDGMINLAEYAVGSDPRGNGGVGARPVPVLFTDPSSGFTYAAINWIPNAAATDILVSAEASDNLVTWESTEVDIRSNGPVRTAVALGFQRFLRLKITLE